MCSPEACVIRALKFSYFSEKPPRLHLFLGETLKRGEIPIPLSVIWAFLKTVIRY